MGVLTPPCPTVEGAEDEGAGAHGSARAYPTALRAATKTLWMQHMAIVLPRRANPCDGGVVQLMVLYLMPCSLVASLSVNLRLLLPSQCPVCLPWVIPGQWLRGWGFGWNCSLRCSATIQSPVVPLASANAWAAAAALAAFLAVGRAPGRGGSCSRGMSSFSSCSGVMGLGHLRGACFMSPLTPIIHSLFL